MNKIKENLSNLDLESLKDVQRFLDKMIIDKTNIMKQQAPCANVNDFATLKKNFLPSDPPSAEIQSLMTDIEDLKMPYSRGGIKTTWLTENNVSMGI